MRRLYWAGGDPRQKEGTLPFDSIGQSSTHQDVTAAQQLCGLVLRPTLGYCLPVHLLRLAAVQHAAQVIPRGMTGAHRRAAMQMGRQAATPTEVCSLPCQSWAQRADPTQSLSSMAWRPCSSLRTEGPPRASMPVCAAQCSSRQLSQGRNMFRLYRLSRGARCPGTQCPTARPCCSPCLGGRTPQQVLQ